MRYAANTGIFMDSELKSKPLNDDAILPSVQDRIGMINSFWERRVI